MPPATTSIATKGWRIVLGVLAALLLPMLASAVLAGALSLAGAADWRPLAWVLLIPALYFTWLLTLLALSALEFQLLGRLHPKPRRLVIEDGRLTMQASVLMLSYQRADQLIGLPFASGLLRIPVLQKLYLLAHAPHVHL